MSILDIPTELLFKIMVHIKDLAQVNYMLVNKKFDETILDVVYHYDNKYENLVPDWENNRKTSYYRRLWWNIISYEQLQKISKN